MAARLRADLAEKRIKRKDLVRLTERSPKTVERWTNEVYEEYRPTRSEALLIAYLTGYPVSRYTGDETDDILFPLYPAIASLKERLRAVEERLAEAAEPHAQAEAHAAAEDRK